MSTRVYDLNWRDAGVYLNKIKNKQYNLTKYIQKYRLIELVVLDRSWSLRVCDLRTWGRLFIRSAVETQLRCSSSGPEFVHLPSSADQSDYAQHGHISPTALLWEDLAISCFQSRLKWAVLGKRFTSNMHYIIRLLFDVHANHILITQIHLFTVKVTADEASSETTVTVRLWSVAEI